MLLQGRLVLGSSAVQEGFPLWTPELHRLCHWK